MVAAKNEEPELSEVSRKLVQAERRLAARKQASEPSKPKRIVRRVSTVEPGWWIRPLIGTVLVAAIFIAVAWNWRWLSEIFVKFIP